MHSQEAKLVMQKRPPLSEACRRQWHDVDDDLSPLLILNSDTTTTHTAQKAAAAEAAASMASASSSWSCSRSRGRRRVSCHLFLFLLLLPYLASSFQLSLRQNRRSSSTLGNLGLRSSSSRSSSVTTSASVTSLSPAPPLTLTQVEIRQATVRDFPAIAESRNAIIFVPKQGGGSGAGAIRRALDKATSKEEREILSKIPYLVTEQAIAFIAVGRPNLSLGGVLGSSSGKPRVVGTVDVFEREAEGSALPRRLFLKNMIVDQAFRRQGFARRLLARVEEHARNKGIKDVYLEVLANNEGAMQLYTQQGFEFTSNPMELLWRVLGIGRVTMVKKL
jgi:ribosomal protein S18 acetylase RimI-like enzyme|eukprot:evm.model.NODE_35542_length_20336_cov_24.742279.6